ncbi:hypothetical protein BGZ91_000778, partial [Linnemannia elongata]
CDFKAVEIIAWQAKSEIGEALQVQLRENNRTDASILSKLLEYMEQDFPNPSPIVLDILDSRALVYTVRKIEPGVFGAGAVAEKLVVLPINTYEMMHNTKEEY